MNIVITGKNGYISNNLKNRLGGALLDARKNIPDIECNVLIHCSAIVHRKNIPPEEYLNVNAELTKRLAQIKAKHFIFFSTMSVYGMDSGIISRSNALRRSKAFGGKISSR